MTRVAATYAGSPPRQLAARPGDPYHDGSDAVVSTTLLYTGSTLMIDETEGIGATYLVDPKGSKSRYLLDNGLALLSIHSAVEDWETLIGVQFDYVGDATIPAGRWMYEFHAARSDFALVTPDATRIDNP